MAEHEWIHDASCAECGAKAREVVFDPHPLEPLEGGWLDKDGVFWPTCARCGRIHYNQWPDHSRIYMNRVNALEAEVATLTTERDRYRADSERFEWLAGALDFDVKLGDADPEEFVTEENQSPVDAWRKAVDCVLGLGRAEALAGTGETG